MHLSLTYIRIYHNSAITANLSLLQICLYCRSVFTANLICLWHNLHPACFSTGILYLYISFSADSGNQLIQIKQTDCRNTYCSFHTWQSISHLFTNLVALYCSSNIFSAIISKIIANLVVLFSSIRYVPGNQFINY